jgi:hypothetical protein
MSDAKRSDWKVDEPPGTPGAQALGEPRRRNQSVLG